MPAGLIIFDEFALDCNRYELLRDGRPIKLEKIPMELLILLVTKDGHLVTRQEIIEHLWGNDVFVDTEHGINTAIRKIRSALKDDPERPRFVQTITGKGYRFIAELRNGNGSAAAFTEVVDVTAGKISAPSGNAAMNLPPKPDSPFWLRTVVAFVLALSIFGAALYWITKPPTMPHVVASHALTKTGVRKNPEFQSRVLTDGVSVYYQEARPSGTATMLVAASGGDAAELTASVEGGLTDISPDGSQALFAVPTTAGFDAWIQALPTGTPRLLIKDARFPTWTADGRHVLFARRGDHELWRANANGADTQRLADFPDISGIAVSPDGDHIRVSDAGGTLWEADPDGTHAKAVVTDFVVGKWSPDGKFFFFSKTDPDQTNLYVRSEERHWWERNSPLRQLTFGPFSIFRPAAISKDGKHIYAVGTESHGELSVYDQHTQAFVPYLGGMPACDVDFSRDGKWVAYVSYPEGTLWRRRIDGTERRQLTVRPMTVSNPRWSPDGKRIVFWDAQGLRLRKVQIYVVDAEGGGPTLLPATGKNPIDPTWSPDGKAIAYSVGGGSPDDVNGIWILDLSSQKSSKIPGSAGFWSARWSPDGKHLVALGGNPSKLWLFSFDSQKWSELISGNPNWPSWSRDSNSVYAEMFAEASIVRVGISDHKVERIASFKGFPFAAVAFMGVTPDGRPIMTRDTGIEEVYDFDLEY